MATHQQYISISQVLQECSSLTSSISISSNIDQYITSTPFYSSGSTYVPPECIYHTPDDIQSWELGIKSRLNLVRKALQNVDTLDKNIIQDTNPPLIYDKLHDTLLIYESLSDTSHTLPQRHILAQTYAASMLQENKNNNNSITNSSNNNNNINNNNKSFEYELLHTFQSHGLIELLLSSSSSSSLPDDFSIATPGTAYCSLHEFKRDDTTITPAGTHTHTHTHTTTLAGSPAVGTTLAGGTLAAGTDITPSSSMIDIGPSITLNDTTITTASSSTSLSSSPYTVELGRLVANDVYEQGPEQALLNRLLSYNIYNPLDSFMATLQSSIGSFMTTQSSIDNSTNISTTAIHSANTTTHALPHTASIIQQHYISLLSPLYTSSLYDFNQRVQCIINLFKTSLNEESLMKRLECMYQIYTQQPSLSLIKIPSVLEQLEYSKQAWNRSLSNIISSQYNNTNNNINSLPYLKYSNYPALVQSYLSTNPSILLYPSPQYTVLSPLLSSQQQIVYISSLISSNKYIIPLLNNATTAKFLSLVCASSTVLPPHSITLDPIPHFSRFTRSNTPPTIPFSPDPTATVSPNGCIDGDIIIDPPIAIPRSVYNAIIHPMSISSSSSSQSASSSVLSQDNHTTPQFSDLFASSSTIQSLLYNNTIHRLQTLTDYSIENNNSEDYDPDSSKNTNNIQIKSPDCLNIDISLSYTILSLCMHLIPSYPSTKRPPQHFNLSHIISHLFPLTRIVTFSSISHSAPVLLRTIPRSLANVWSSSSNQNTSGYVTPSSFMLLLSHCLLLGKTLSHALPLTTMYPLPQQSIHFSPPPASITINTSCTVEPAVTLTASSSSSSSSSLSNDTNNHINATNNHINATNNTSSPSLTVDTTNITPQQRTSSSTSSTVDIGLLYTDLFNIQECSYNDDNDDGITNDIINNTDMFNNKSLYTISSPSQLPSSSQIYDDDNNTNNHHNIIDDNDNTTVSIKQYNILKTNPSFQSRTLQDQIIYGDQVFLSFKSNDIQQSIELLHHNGIYIMIHINFDTISSILSSSMSTMQAPADILHNMDIYTHYSDYIDKSDLHHHQASSQSSISISFPTTTHLPFPPHIQSWISSMLSLPESDRSKFNMAYSMTISYCSSIKSTGVGASKMQLSDIDNISFHNVLSQLSHVVMASSNNLWLTAFFLYSLLASSSSKC